MQNNSITMQYKYTVSMYYLDNVRNINNEIPSEYIKSIVIDHNYDKNYMPIVYITLSLDKRMLDDMILNSNKNLFILSISKYNDLSDDKQQIECFREKFIYFIPKNVNKSDGIDYNEMNESQTMGNTFIQLTMGLMCLKHINNNKKSLELIAKNNTILDCVKYCTSHMNNLIIEPFIYNDTYDQIIMRPQDSVSKALNFLNNYRVFYNTPYRYYQDFNFTYIISSSGNAISKKDELYSSILINVMDIDNTSSNNIGFSINKSSNTYEVPVSYANTQVYDGSINNKSVNMIKTMSHTGTSIKSLKNNASYSTSKYKTINVENDNENIIYNIEAENNSNNFFLYFAKEDIDSDLFTINKRISVNNIDRYKDHDGTYLMSRKRECYMREDKNFGMTTLVNLKQIM